MHIHIFYNKHVYIIYLFNDSVNITYIKNNTITNSIFIPCNVLPSL